MKKLLLLFALSALSVFGQSSHQYWRLITLSGNSSFVSVGQWTSFTSGGSTISTSGGTASASSQSFGAASNAFNGTTNCSTDWQSGNNGATGDWLEMAFASAVAIDHFTLVAGCNGGYGIVDFALQYSDNNSTWATANSWYGVAWTSAAQSISFTSTNAAPATLGVAWRILDTSDGACVSLSNLKFYNKSSVQVSTPAYAAPTSTTFNAAYGAFGTLNASGTWATAGAGTNQWVEYDFPTIVGLSSISFAPPTTGGCGNVNHFSIQYSFDRSAWTTTDSYDPTWSGAAKTFNVTGGPSGATFTPQIGVFLVSE